MPELRKWGIKPRTMLRFVKPGDIFALALPSGFYAFGRILSRVDIGHVTEFFDRIGKEADIPLFDPMMAVRFGSPVVIDSFALFDRKISGNWQIIGHQENFVPHNVDEVRFTYSNGHQHWAVDVFGVEREVTKALAEKLPKYSPREDWDIQEMLAPLLKCKD